MNEHSESSCLLCVMNYVNKLIAFEVIGVDIKEFTPEDLLFLAGERVTDKNIADMTQAKEYLYTERNIQYMR